MIKLWDHLFYLPVYVLLLLVPPLLRADQGETSSPQEGKTVLVAILARNKEHTLPRFLSCIERLDYDKKLITIYINTNNNEDRTLQVLQDWSDIHKNDYRAIIFENHSVQDLEKRRPHDWTPQRFKVLGTIRNKSLQQAKEQKCDFYFVVDCDNFITPCTLKELVNKDKPIIAPMLRSIPDACDPYSNYFCDISPTGYWKSHPNYRKILYRQMVGTFQVPVVHCTYLIKTEFIDSLGYVDGTDDYEFVIFSRLARSNNIPQFICNEKEFGVLWHVYGENVKNTLQQEKERYLQHEAVGLS